MTLTGGSHYVSPSASFEWQALKPLKLRAEYAYYAYFDAPEQHASIVTKLYTGPYDSVARRANIVTALRGVLRNAFGID